MEKNDIRQGTIVDSDNLQGSAFFDSFGATVNGASATFESGMTPVDIMAYGLYQHIARPDPSVPFMLNVFGYYQDADPVDVDPNEGYYVLYADYSLSRWVIGGLYKTTNTRIQLPETADVISPSGFIYTAVVAYNGNSVKVTNVKVGYDDGPGYEQYVLPEVPGMAVGGYCDIELDEAGVPQIAYMAGSSMIEANDAQVRVARLVGETWEIQDLTLPDIPMSFDFAIGSAGRRALIVFDDAGHQTLLLDMGTGDFTVDYNSNGGGLVNDPLNSAKPAITYINGADDAPGGIGYCPGFICNWQCR